MKPANSRVLISDSIGHVSTLTLQPDVIKAAIVLAHGAGAGMNHPFMERLAQKLSDLSIASIRFNFPYMENKKRMPDVPTVAEKTVGSILQLANETFSNKIVFLAGKSFGGRMSSQYISKNGNAKCAGLIFYGFPLHAPGRPDIQRATHLKDVKTPLLFLQGTNDTLASLPLIEKVSSELPTSTLIKFEGADHSFKVKSKELIDDLALSTLHWIEKIVT